MKDDSVIAHKFAVMQQQIEQKDKRIQELEELKEALFRNYQEQKLQKEEQALNIKEVLKENYIPKQAVIDKMEELNKEIKNGDEIEAIFKIKQQQILQELLEGRNENG